MKVPWGRADMTQLILCHGLHDQLGKAVSPWGRWPPGVPLALTGWEEQRNAAEGKKAFIVLT